MSIDKLPAVSSSVGRPSHTRTQRAAAPATDAAVSTTPKAAESQELVDRKIESIAKQLESYMKSVNRSLEFRVDAASGRTVVSVRDAETGDLIRQIPSEEVLHLAQMAEDQTLVLVDQKV